MGEGNTASCLPEAFVDRLRATLPAARVGAALASFDAEKPTSFRVNTLKAQPSEVAALLREAGLTPSPVPGIDSAFTVPPEQRSALTQSALVSDGRVYIQGVASMLAPLALDAQPGESVLDLCAAPGGKTLMLAAMMRNAGVLNAVEPGKTRFFKLRANLERGGATMVKTYHTDGRSVGRKTPGRFDRVLVDAPCAGEAMFTTRDPASYADWSEKKVRRCARVQKALLRAALAAVRPGGVVLYCTCSMSVAENEGVVAHTLAKLGDAVAAETLPGLPAQTMPALTAWRGKSLPEAVGRGVRVLPTAEHDAFFLMLLRRVL
ncbi:MAG: RsmB/NOP family class I SAM-dependent RNA methyltransferase [Phycisphaerales bacterium JB063]